MRLYGRDFYYAKHAWVFLEPLTPGSVVAHRPTGAIYVVVETPVDVDAVDLRRIA